MEGKRVVVLGGGVAGSCIAKSLQSRAHVTLIDPKEYFEIPWGYVRATVEPSFAERSLINHRDYLNNGNIVTSSATDVTETEVVIADGQKITYDYLVIATGRKDPVPESRTERLDQYQQENKKIKSAKSILVVGGGPTGVELAAEIAVDYPDKKVTLVHRGTRLLEFIGSGAGNKALTWLKSKNVEVKLEQSVEVNCITDGQTTFQTSLGETIDADCHFLCTGKPLSSSWLKETVLKNDLDDHGRLMVDENLRVQGWNNIFAIGDITNIPEVKQGFSAHNHAGVVARNIRMLMERGNECKLETYKPQSLLAIVTLGRRDAVAQLKFLTMAGRIPGLIKSGDMFVGKTRRQMGL